MPVNHHLRPLYRVLAGLCGVYVLVFGILALVRAGGVGFFAQDGLPAVLGLHANRGFAVLSIVAGVVVIGGVAVGGNVNRWVNLVAGIGFLVVGLAMLTVMETELNVLGFTPATSIVWFVIGLVLFAAGLYGQVGPAHQERREERFRHGAGPDPEHHVLGAENVPRAQG